MGNVVAIEYRMSAKVMGKKDFFANSKTTGNGLDYSLVYGAFITLDLLAKDTDLEKPPFGLLFDTSAIWFTSFSAYYPLP